MADTEANRKKVFTWRIPAEYARSAPARNEIVRSRLQIWIPSAVAGILVWIAIDLLINRSLDSDAVIQALIIIPGVSFPLAVGYGQRAIVCPGSVQFLRRIAWKRIRWYRISDMPEFPSLRALEISCERRGTEKTLLVPFDPTQTNEAEMAAFLSEVAPGKLWQH